MRSVWLLATTLLFMPVVAAAQQEPVRPAEATAAPVSKPPLATNRRSFFIPVSVDRASGDHVPVEVHLLVSADQGRTWSTYARQGPESNGFQFQSRDDGEYWFASRTLDAQGKTKPAGDAEAELRIVIDSTPPKIELDAAASGNSEITAAWRISDASLLPAGIRVEYQAAENLKPAWQSVTVDPTLQKSGGGMLLGSAKWAPMASSRVIDIRIIAQDRAGNLGTDTRRVVLPRRSDVPTSRLPEYASRPAPKSSEASANVGGDPFTARQFGTGGSFKPDAPEPATPTAIEPSKPTGTPWPGDNKLPETPLATPSPQDKLADQPAALPTQPLARTPGEVAPPVSNRVVAKPSSTDAGSSPLIWPAEAKPEPPVANSPPALQTIPSTAIPSTATPSVDPPVSGFDAPANDIDKPQLSSSKSFALDYDVDSVGPSGLRAAELWVTVDGGSTWEKWGEDEDKRSPFEIQVQSERTFGFRMVIVANNGLATRSPEPGDPADIVVAVDSSKPRVRLLQAAYGQGEHAGQLDIRWEADDDHLGQRPVAIAFSDSPDGPFTTLAAGLPNSGQHYWTIDPQTPRKLYLRLEVRDDAGNLGVDQTAEPISLEGLSPKGRIRGVVPGPAASPAIQGAFRTPLFR